MRPFNAWWFLPNENKFSRCQTYWCHQTVKSPNQQPTGTLGQLWGDQLSVLKKIVLNQSNASYI